MSKTLSTSWLRSCCVTAWAAVVMALAAAGSASAGGHGGGHASAEEEEEFEVGADVKTRGIGLGEYHVKSYHMVEAQKCTVRFVLFASVPSEQYAPMKQLVELNEHKLRDQVIIATRMAPLLIFDEPDLASFRRRIFLRLRRSLPELVFDQLHVSEFQLTVKSL